MSKMTQIPQNYKNMVDWVFGAYENAGVTLDNGFQKDAIQNAVGARIGKHWNDFQCDISIVTTSKGAFLVVEDSGTVGLTGENISSETINAKMANGEKFPPTERLARFTSMNNSGGNTGPGLYGVGKSVYSVASSTYTYYFDSLRADGKYVANVNRQGQVYSLAFEDNAAKDFIRKYTGLPPKTSTGTRIIIENPKDEIVASINSGDMVKYIQESWWLIIDRLGNNSHISVGGVPVKVPAGIKEATRKYESTIEVYKPNYRVKNFGVYLSDDGSNLWSGISYYRAGMKIGEVDLKDIPDKLSGKYWGYIEVDESWELELSEIEDTVHFGVSKRKKTKSAYQNLKNFCSERFRKLLIEWGYIKDKENQDKKLRDELKQIAEDIQDLFNTLGFEDLGRGPQKADFDVRWKNIQYPEVGTERVTTGDTIGFTMRVKSAYATQKKFDYVLRIVNPQTKSVISEIKKGTISVLPGEIYEETFAHQVTKENSLQYAENRVVLVVKVKGSNNEKAKELPFFYDIDKPANAREEVTLTLHECTFPNQGSRRVNFGEALQNVSYRIENKRNHPLPFRLNVSIHNASDGSNTKIVDVISLTGNIGPYEELVTDHFADIVFDQATYEQYLSAGPLELRARLIAADDTGEYEKGDRITYYYYKVFLNTDEKHGKNDAFDVKSIEASDDYRRSYFEKTGNDRTIVLNVGHPAYLFVADFPDVQHEYMREQMLKQYVLLYLSEGKYDMFCEPGEEFGELDTVTAADRVIAKIERVYSQSLD